MTCYDMYLWVLTFMRCLATVYHETCKIHSIYDMCNVIVIRVNYRMVHAIGMSTKNLH
jgi:hypothetical protein